MKYLFILIFYIKIKKVKSMRNIILPLADANMEIIIQDIITKKWIIYLFNHMKNLIRLLRGMHHIKEK